MRSENHVVLDAPTLLLVLAASMVIYTHVSYLRRHAHAEELKQQKQRQRKNALNIFS